MRKLKMTIILVLLIGGIFALSTTTPVSAARMTAAEFYDEFTAEDRLHIRTAMDYAIPRQQIIDSVLSGLGTTLATPVERHTGAYDPTVTAREFSIEKALDEMEEAFGYRYNDSAETDEERKGYFSMVIMAPPWANERMQWAALITKTFQEIGIDVTLKYANWNVAKPVFTPPIEHQGFDYKHGGYDAFFIGWLSGPDSDPTYWFGKDNWAPAGNNIGYIDDATVDEILDRALQSPAKADRDKAFDEFQVWFKANLPYFIVVQGMDWVVMDPDLGGVSINPIANYPNFRNWTHTTATEITHQIPYPILDVNPLMSWWGYYRMAHVENYDGLITRYSDDPDKYYGNLAESWTSSDNGLVWTFNVRDGIKFNNGSDFSVDDVIFTYEQIINPEVNALVYGEAEDVKEYLNKTGIRKVNDTAVEFTLNDFYAYGESLFVWPILSKAEMSAVPDAEWRTHATTTTYAPLGTGPYMMDEDLTNVTETKITMVLNPHYNGSLRDPDGQFDNPNMIPTINLKLISTEASAIAALKAGEINILSFNVDVNPFIYEINNSDWGKLVKFHNYGHQAFYINQMNPIWGMNAQDPRKMYPGDYRDIPFDLTAVFLAILMLASIQIIRSKKK